MTYLSILAALNIAPKVEIAPLERRVEPVSDDFYKIVNARYDLRRFNKWDVSAGNDHVVCTLKDGLTDEEYHVNFERLEDKIVYSGWFHDPNDRDENGEIVTYELRQIDNPTPYQVHSHRGALEANFLIEVEVQRSLKEIKEVDVN